MDANLAQLVFPSHESHSPLSFLSLTVRRLKTAVQEVPRNEITLSVGEFDDVFLTNSLPLTNNPFRKNSIIGVHPQTQPLLYEISQNVYFHDLHSIPS